MALLGDRHSGPRSLRVPRRPIETQRGSRHEQCHSRTRDHHRPLAGSHAGPTWTLYDDAAGTQLTDLTDWKAWLLLWGSDIATPVKTLSDSTGVAPDEDTQGTTGIILGAALGTIRAYLTDEDALAIVHGQFTEGQEEDGSPRFTGGYELVLEDPAGERFPYETGPLRFRPRRRSARPTTP